MKKLLLAIAISAALPAMAQEHTEHVTSDVDSILAAAHVALKDGDTAKAEELFSQAETIGSSQATTIAAIRKALDPDPIQNAMAYGTWIPGPGECSRERHDAYNVVFEGIRYYTWHPAVLPATDSEPACPTGHEHGDDPETFAGYDKANFPVAFGYQNEMAMQAGITHVMRAEDHNGQKVAVGFDLPFGYNGIPENITCDVLAVFHQGTHSKDAFTNNLHAQSHQMQCSNGWTMRVQMLTRVQKAGEFTAVGLLKNIINAGAPVPENSPLASHPWSPGRSMGTRQIPTCEQVKLGTYRETWQTINTISAPSVGTQRNFIRFSDYWNVSNPSRCYDPAAPGLLSRPNDLCWLPGETTPYLINKGLCVTARKKPQVAWDSPDSLFNGSSRSMRADSWTLKLPASLDPDGDGLVVWYSDALGLNASLEPFPGSLKQVASAVYLPQVQYGLRDSDMLSRFEGDRTGVHAPN